MVHRSDAAAERRYTIDLTGMAGRVQLRPENGITALSGPSGQTLLAPSARSGLLEAIGQGVASYTGSLEDATFVQLLRYQLLGEGSLSRFIDYDRLLPVGAARVRPDNVAVVLTKLCNLRCLHCYNDSGRRDERELSSDQKIRLVEYLGRWGVPLLTLTGGEPTLDPAFEGVLELARTFGMRVKVTTNGWRVPTTLLRAIDDGTVLQVNVSLDGADADTHDYLRARPGSFARVVQALAILRAHAPRMLVLNVSIHRSALSQMAQIAEIGASLGVTAVSYKAVTMTGRSGPAHPEQFLLDRDELQAFAVERDRLREVYRGQMEIDGKLIAETVAEDLLERVACNAGSTSMFIDADGVMLPCETLHPWPSAPRFPAVAPAAAWANDDLFVSFRSLRNRSAGGCGTPGCPGVRARAGLAPQLITLRARRSVDG